MSLARKQALISGIAWLVVAVSFVVIIADSGMAALSSADGKTTRSILSAVILPAYVINFGILWRTRRGRQEGDIDERDEAIERRATEFTAIVVFLAVFLYGIALFDANVETGSVPAGWLYILAYGTMVLISVLHPLARLFVDLTGRVDG